MDVICHLKIYTILKTLQRRDMILFSMCQKEGICNLKNHITNVDKANVSRTKAKYQPAG
jgi:selenocysteine-specific translation elongation factor